MNDTQSVLAKRISRYICFVSVVVVLVMVVTTYFDDVKRTVKQYETDIQYVSLNNENILEYVRKVVTRKDYSIDVDIPEFDMALRKGLNNPAGSIGQQEAISSIQRSYLNISDSTLEYIRYLMMIYSGEFSYNQRILTQTCADYKKLHDGFIVGPFLKYGKDFKSATDDRCDIPVVDTSNFR